MNQMYELFGDQEFKYFASLREQGSQPKEKDFKFSEEGIYVLRTGWDSNADYLCTHSTQLELGERSTHSHNDCMHAEITLKGEDILVDSGRYIYRSSIWKDWRAYFCSALAHNTLYVDNHEMGEIKGVDRRRNVRCLCHYFGNKEGLKIVDLSHNGYAYLADPVFHRRKLILAPNSVAVLIDYVDGPANENHDFRLMYNFNTTNVVLDGKHVDYKSKNNVDFTVDFTSNVDFNSYLLCGSEDPKGGWISYGYPVKEPIGQVTMAYGGKAPFMAATIIKEKGNDATVKIESEKVVLKIENNEWVITREGVEKL